MGPDLWRRTTSGPEVEYLARRGTVLINIVQAGDSVDEPRIRRTITSMSPIPAAYFRPR